LRRTPLFDRLGLPRQLSRRGKSLAYSGTFLAMAGLGGVVAAAATSAPASPAGIAGTSQPGRAPAVSHARLADASAAHDARHALTAAGASPAPVAGQARAAGRPMLPLTASLGHLAVPAAPGRAAAPARPAHAAPAHGATAHAASAHAATAHAATAHAATAHAATATAHAAKSWTQVRDELARQMTPRARPGTLPMADRLVAGPASGPQSTMPITPAQLANATTIVRQALSKRMGVRAAVIAVATAMQESGLENISYGDRDSLGLFQQRPSMGWGTASQVTTPAYAADAFLKALAAHQKADPGWAGQPLWETAQSVQNSGFPYAYAKWETQAAQLVSAIAMKLG
jgi:hypothetical protein